MKESCCHEHRGKSQSVKVRYTPTFVHFPIFGDVEEFKKEVIRCTPTYYSTALETDGYQIVTNNSSILPKTGQQRGQSEQKCIFRNESKQAKLVSLYPNAHHCQASRPWTGGQEKQQLLKKINSSSGNTYKLRKYVEQLSDPIFNGYVWDVPLNYSKQINRQEQKIPQLEAKSQKQNDKKQLTNQPAEKQNIPVIVQEVKQNKNLKKKVTKKENLNKPKSKSLAVIRKDVGNIKKVVQPVANNTKKEIAKNSKTLISASLPTKK